MNQIDAMRCFVRVIETGTFSAVAKERNATQSSISKKISNLEATLNCQLMTRTSRIITLTDAGERYFEYCKKMLEELDEVEQSLKTDTMQPSGTIRVTAPTAFGKQLLTEPLKQFLALYPEINLELSLNDRQVDLVSEGFDIAIRASHLNDSSLKARLLFNNHIAYFAAPAYLDVHGHPQTPEQLTQHQCIQYSLAKTSHQWQFTDGTNQVTVPISGRFCSDSADMILDMAIAGHGIAALPNWMVESAASKNDIEVILKQYSSVSLPMYAVYPNTRHTPKRLRCFIDYLVEAFANLAADKP